MDFSRKDLQGKSFKGENLQNADFSGADLRGADFSSSNLSGADFSKSKTGMRTKHIISVFIFALLVSLSSGYIAMLMGNEIRKLLASPDLNERISGYLTSGSISIFVIVALWKGLFNAVSRVFTIIIALAVISGLFAYFSGLGDRLRSFRSYLHYFLRWQCLLLELYPGLPQVL